MTNRDMVRKPGPGPAPRKRDAPRGERTSASDPREVRHVPDEVLDPPDSPQVKPQNRK